MKYTIGTKHFNTQKEMDNHYRDIISRYEWGETLSPEDHIDAFELLQFHPDKEEKIGVGLDHIEIRRNTRESHGYNTKCFFIIRTDGSDIDFSKKCIQHVPKNK